MGDESIPCYVFSSADAGSKRLTTVVACITATFYAPEYSLFTVLIQRPCPNPGHRISCCDPMCLCNAHRFKMLLEMTAARLDVCLVYLTAVTHFSYRLYFLP